MHCADGFADCGQQVWYWNMQLFADLSLLKACSLYKRLMWMVPRSLLVHMQSCCNLPNSSLHADGTFFCQRPMRSAVWRSLHDATRNAQPRCHQRKPVHCCKRLALPRVVRKCRLGQTVRAPLLAHRAYGSAGIHRRSGPVLPTSAFLACCSFLGEAGEGVIRCEAVSYISV